MLEHTYQHFVSTSSPPKCSNSSGNVTITSLRKSLMNWYVVFRIGLTGPKFPLEHFAKSPGWPFSQD